MRISDWSSDVCSSDLAKRSPCLGWTIDAVDRPSIAILGQLTVVLVVAQPVHFPFEILQLSVIRLRLLQPLQDHERPFVLVHPYRSEEHTSELQSLIRISYAVFCLKKKIAHHHLLY